MAQQDDDEVARRAQLVQAKRQERHARTTSREQEMFDGPSRLIEAISDRVQSRTGASFALQGNKIICFVGTEERHHVRVLVEVGVANDTDDLEDEDWELAFNLTSFVTVDDDGDFTDSSEYDLCFDDAVETGTEAVLDGMAIVLGQENTIADARRILAPPSAGEPLSASSSNPPLSAPTSASSNGGLVISWVAVTSISVALVMFFFLLSQLK